MVAAFLYHHVRGPWTPPLTWRSVVLPLVCAVLFLYARGVTCQKGAQPSCLGGHESFEDHASGGAALIISHHRFRSVAQCCRLRSTKSNHLFHIRKSGSHGDPI